MPAKKSHKPRTGLGKKAASSAQGRKGAAQTEGQYSRDPKGRKGQYTAAGDAPIMKK